MHKAQFCFLYLPYLFHYLGRKQDKMRTCSRYAAEEVSVLTHESALFQFIKQPFITIGRQLWQHSHFPASQPESFKTWCAQNEVPSSMYCIDFVIDCIPWVSIWKPVRHKFFS